MRFNFCMLLPGPEAMQLATYVGWRLHGTLGGLAAGLLFVLPGALVVLALEHRLRLFRPSPARRGGLPRRQGGRAGHRHRGAACASRGARCAVPTMSPSPPRPSSPSSSSPRPSRSSSPPRPWSALLHAPAAPAPLGSAARACRRCRSSQTLKTAALWLAIWIVPLLVVAALFGRAHVTTDIALFFSKLAVVTFGGAYSVLAYMAQQAVETYGWLSAGEMLDGLGLAETTPARSFSSPSSSASSPASAKAASRRSPSACSALPSRCGRPSRPASSGSSSARPMSSA